MAEQLAYALITPYSLAKSRTGGIIGRLISQVPLEFVGARMYSPSDAFIDKYLACQAKARIEARYHEAFREYVEQNFRSDGASERGFTNRFLMLLFRGKNARKELRAVVGPPTAQPIGNTVRGTYGDCVMRGSKIEYFEPAVLAAPDDRTNKAVLKLLADYAEKDGGVLDTLVKYPKGVKPETTLVMLKPDNFYKRSARPGNIIDIFSKTGLTIVGARLFRMSVQQGLEFYGFLEDIFVKKLGFLVENTLRDRLEDAYDFPLEDEDYAAMTDLLRRKNAHCEVCKIIEFMTGRHPDHVSRKEQREPGDARCLALLYHGPNAIELIRDRLGTTDPSKAEGGTVRSDYGTNLMVNGAHASDSSQSAGRERPIVGLAGGEKSDEKREILAYLKGNG
ncbi:MAG: nucleoside-diphosphate kinase [Planctomycetota bacterium]